MTSILNTPIAASALYLIDSRIGLGDRQALISELPEGSAWEVLEEDRDGLEQIRDIVSGFSGLTSLHLIGYGTPGGQLMGTGYLNLAALNQHAALLAQIGARLAPDADILLYGCNVGQGVAGQAFIDRLAELTGADVAASTDLTGARGDWALEAATGSIEAATVNPLGFSETLDPAPTVGTLRTTNRQPTLTGTAILGSGRTLEVEVNGKTYKLGSNLTYNNGVWTLTLPSADVLPDTGSAYDVKARIVDAPLAAVAISGSSTVTASASNAVNLLIGSNGNDTITGRSDTRADIAVFSGNRSAYTIAAGTGGITVTGQTTGTDTLSNLNLLKFADGQEFVAAAAQRVALTGTEASHRIAVDASKLYNGTRAAETFVVAKNVSAMILAGDGDTVDLTGRISDYTYTARGSQLQVSDGTYLTTINVGGSVTLRTASGSTPITYSGGAITMGGQTVGSSFNVGSITLNAGNTSSNQSIIYDASSGELVVFTDSTAPTLTSSSPADNATVVGLGSNIVLTFSEPVGAVSGKNILINKSTDGSTAMTIAATDTSQVSISGNVVTINPTGYLASGIAYYVNIDNGAFNDLSDNAYAGISNNTSLNFTAVTDSTPPTLRTNSPVSPAQNATGIAKNSNIILAFSEDVVAGAGTISILNNSNGQLTDIAVSDTSQVAINGNVVTINPKVDLAYNTTYSISTSQTTPAFKDISGNSFAGISASTPYRFTTESDTYAPTLVYSTPADNATSISPNANIVLTFSENVTAAASKYVYIKKSDGTIVSTIAANDTTQVTVASGVVTINPTALLDAGVGYYLNVDSGAFKDSSDNAYAGIADSTTLNFTTSAVNHAPSVLAGNSAMAFIPVSDSYYGVMRVSDLIGNAFSDLDAGSGQGIALIGATATNGINVYRNTAGVYGNWTLLSGGVLDSKAALFASTDYIRLTSASYTGSGTLQFRLWDQSNGLTGGTTGVNLSSATSFGGSTAYSAETITANVSFMATTSVGVAPTVTFGAAVKDEAGRVKSIPINFARAVTGFDVGDIQVTRDGVPLMLAEARLTGSGSAYQLENLGWDTRYNGDYVFTLPIDGTGIATVDGVRPPPALTYPAVVPPKFAVTATGTVDNIAPVIAVTSDKTSLINGEVAQLTFTLSESSTNFTAADITVTGGTLENFSGSGKVYTANFKPLANSKSDGVISVSDGVFSDVWHNLNADGSDDNNRITLTVDTTIQDTTPPIVLISSSKPQIITAETTTITFVLSERATDFTADDIVVTGGQLTGFISVGNTGRIYTADFTALPNASSGSISIASNKFTDFFGNSNVDATTLPIDIVLTNPMVSVAADKSILGIGGSTIVRFTLNMPSTDFSLEDVSVSGGALSGFGGSDRFYTATFTPTSGSTADGIISVASGTFSDSAGNINSDGADANNTVHIAVDGLAPTFTSGSTASTVSENSNTALNQVVYTAQATDNASLVYSLKNSGDSSSFAIDPASGVVTLKVNPNYEAKSSYGFTVIANDTAGNTTEQSVTMAITGVNEAPTGAVTIKGIWSSLDNTPQISFSEGQRLVATSTLADAEGLGTLSYQWQLNGVNIANATSSTYAMVASDEGKIISVVVSYTDGAGHAESRSSSEMSDYDSAMLYTLNQIRHDPQTVASQTSVTLPSELPGSIAPVVYHEALRNTAVLQSNDMLRWQNWPTNPYSATTTPESRSLNAGFNSDLVGESIQKLTYAYTDSNSQKIGTQTFVNDSYAAWFGVEADRLNILSPFWNTMGAGYESQYSYLINYTPLSTTIFGSTPTRYLSGFVFSDTIGNDAYNMGEGIGGVTISVTSSTGQTYTSTTSSTGYWCLAVPVNAIYSVTASGGNFSGTSKAIVDFQKDNVEVDFIAGQAVGWTNFSKSAPQITDAVVGLDGERIFLNFNEALAGLSVSKPLATQFTVKVNGVDIVVNSLELHGALVELRLSGQVHAGQQVVVGYTDHSTTDDIYGIQDALGNDASSFSKTFTADLPVGFTRYTAGADSITGTSGDDLMDGAGGADTLHGGDGNDLIYADYTMADSAANALYGDGGNDNIYGSLGNDLLDGGSGNDTLSGGAGNDTLTGGGGDDLLLAGSGNDTVAGGAGNDALIFDLPRSNYFVRALADGTLLIKDMSGQDGIKTVSGVEIFRFAGVNYARADLISNVFTDGNNVITGGDGDDILYGENVNDGSSHYGDDVLFGGSGNDLIYGQLGSDNLYGGAGHDVLYAGSTAYRETGASIINRLYGEEGDDILFGAEQVDILVGGAGNDIIVGGDGYTDPATGTVYGGNDVAVYALNRNQYSVRTSPTQFWNSVTGQFQDQYEIAALSGDEGIDTIRGVEVFRFADGDVTLANMGWGARVTDTAAPVLNSSVPADGSTAVTNSANLVLTFNEAVSPVAYKNIYIRNSSGAAVATIAANDSKQVSISGGVVTINPGTDLAHDADYYVTIDNGAFRDIAYNLHAGISNATTLNFKTASVSDGSAPTLSASFPSDNSTDTAFDSNIVLTFSESVIAAADKYLYIIKKANGTIISTIAASDASQVAIVDNVVTVNPTSDLGYGTEYYVTVDNGAFTDAAGNPFAGVTSATGLNFKTATDTATPILLSSTPSDNGTMATDGALELTFNESVTAASGKYLYIKNANGTTFATIPVNDETQVTVFNGKVTVNPTQNLVAGANYYVTLDSGAFVDGAGNSYNGITDASLLNFEAAAAYSYNELPYWVQSLIEVGEESAPATRHLGTDVHVYFPTTIPSWITSTSIASSWESFSQVEIDWTMNVLNRVARMVDINFIIDTTVPSQNPEAMTIFFAKTNQGGSTAGVTYPYAGPGEAGINYVYINSQQSLGNDDVSGATVVTHELGHALGMPHPFDDRSDTNGQTNLPTADNYMWNTQMSYSGGAPSATDFMPLDIAALQFLYGVPETARPGNDTYVLSGTANSLAPTLIWDGSGVDTVDGRSLTEALTLSLEPGNWSYLGNKKANFMNYGQITVNYDTVIENLLGGSATDDLSGNSANNLIDGGAGNDLIRGFDGADRLNGGAGNDVIDGGAGIDAAFYSLDRDEYNIAQTEKGLQIMALSGNDGIDIVNNVEFFHFADGVSTAADLLSGQVRAELDLPGSTVTISGTTTENQILTATLNLNGAVGSPLIQWLSNDLPIKGATNSTYLLDEAQVGSTMTVQVKYIDVEGSTHTVTSAGTALIGNVDDPGTISIIGSPYVGMSMVAQLADGDGIVAANYQWHAGGVAIGGANLREYVPTVDLVGKVISVTATYTDVYNHVATLSSTATSGVTSLTPTGSVSSSVFTGIDTDDGTMDFLQGSSASETFWGGYGSEIVSAGEGNDTIQSRFNSSGANRSGGSALVDGGAGNDTINGAFTNDILFGGEGDDTMTGWGYLYGGVGSDTLNSASGTASPFAFNTLDGGDGNDTLKGGLGADRLIGGAGNDTIDGSNNKGSGDDTAVFSLARSHYTITMNGSNYVVAANTGTDGTDTVTGVQFFEFAGVAIRTSDIVLG